MQQRASNDANKIRAKNSVNTKEEHKNATHKLIHNNTTYSPKVDVKKLRTHIKHTILKTYTAFENLWRHRQGKSKHSSSYVPGLGCWRAEHQTGTRCQT